MAKKPLEPGASEASKTKKTVARKTAAKKTASAPKKEKASTPKKATVTEKKTVVDVAPVEAPKRKIKTVKPAPKTATKTKSVKQAKSIKKAPEEKAPVASEPVDPVVVSAPVAPVEKEPAVEVVHKTQSPVSIKVKRESFRPNRNPEQQDRHESHGGDVFAQPETVGGAPEGGFNKRKRRRRNKKGNGGEDRQAMSDIASLKQLDGKKVASRAWKMFLAEVSEEGLALMDDQTAREAARRAFRCAELFMMEEVRRKQAQKLAILQQEKNTVSEEAQDAEEPVGEE